MYKQLIIIYDMIYINVSKVICLSKLIIPCDVFYQFNLVVSIH